MQALYRDIPSLDIVTVLLVLCLAFLAFARLVNENRFIDFLILPINNRFWVKTEKEIRFESPFNILMLVVQLVSLCLFGLLITKTLDLAPSIPDYLILLRLALIYVMFMALKYFIERIIAVLLNGEEIISLYHHNKIAYRNYIGLFLIPINALFFYSHKTFPLVIKILVLLLLVINVISLLQLFRKHEKLINGNLFYFILYLCALEIAPYLILYKMFDNGAFL